MILYFSKDFYQLSSRENPTDMKDKSEGSKMSHKSQD